MKGWNVFMKVLVKQINKELFEANFDIIENDEVIGNLNLKGHLGTPEVKLTGKLYDKEFNMEEEEKRKEYHDEILKTWGITQSVFQWGYIKSEYDSKSNISSIDIVFG